MLVQQRHEEAETSKLSINLFFAGKKELSTEEGSKKEGTRNILNSVVDLSQLLNMNSALCFPIASRDLTHVQWEYPHPTIQLA